MKLKYYFTISLILFFTFHAEGQFYEDFEAEVPEGFFSAPMAELSSNPDTLNNSSSKVLYFKKERGDWQAVLFTFQDSIALDALDRISFKLRTSTLGRVYVKMYKGQEVLYKEWAFSYNFKPNPDRWVDIIFPFEIDEGEKMSHLEIFASVNNTTEADVFLDDLKIYNQNSPNGEPVLQVVDFPTQISEGDILNVDASNSYDNDTIVEKIWTINGDTVYQGTSGITHVFDSAGIYQLGLTLVDNDQNTSQETWTIFVFGAGQRMSQVSFPTQIEQHGKIEGLFKLRSEYQNPYDPDEIKVDAVISYPNGMVKKIPCFFSQSVDYDNGNWVVRNEVGDWYLRFSSEQTGLHQVHLELEDAQGTEISEAQMLEVFPSSSKGIIRRSEEHPQQLIHADSSHFFPLGINAAWDNMSNYELLIRNLANGDANLFRYWHAAFTNQALEWDQGLNNYRPIAAAKQDLLLELCAEYGIYLQMCIFHHGMFSQTVNSNWSQSPYNKRNGGPLDRPENFFYDQESKVLSKKLLRYIIARWSYSENLFAWELFNEVQWTGNHPFQSDRWETEVINWHEEMSHYIQEIDPFQHLVTTSAEDHQLRIMDERAFLDIIQYHTYPSASVINELYEKDKSFLNSSKNAMVICGEYGYAGDGDVPLREQRLAIWSSIFSSVPHFIWRWQVHYQDLWTELFIEPASYLQMENLMAFKDREQWHFSALHNELSLEANGFKKDSIYYGMIHDAQFSNNILGSTLTTARLPFGEYLVQFIDLGSNTWESRDFSYDQVGKSIDLPEFRDGLVFSLTRKSALSQLIAYAGEDGLIGFGQRFRLDASNSSIPNMDNTQISWDVINQPDSSSISLEQLNGLQAEITPDYPGDYSIQLTLQQDENEPLYDTLNLFVSDIPVAIAGADQIVFLGDRPNLNGRQSFDPENERLRYQWEIIEQPKGSNPDFRFTTSSRPIFVPDTLGIYWLTLTVNDGLSDSTPDSIKIEVIESITTSVLDPLKSEIAIFPNPNSGQFIIDLGKESLQIAQIEIYNALGQLIYQDQLKRKLNNVDLEKEQIIDGLHLIKISFEDGQSLSKSILIQGQF